MRVPVRVAAIACICLMAACSEFNADDQDFSDNRRSFDITNDNAEATMWSAYQAVFLPLHYAELHTVLDAAFAGTMTGAIPCSGGGSVDVSYPQEVAGIYEVDDRFSLEYDNCTENGVTSNGLISGRYTAIEGLNVTFSDSVTIDACAAEIISDNTGPTVEIDDSADAVVFDKQGSRLFVRYLDENPSSAGTSLTHEVYELEVTGNAVVLNRSKATGRFNSSLEEDGAELYRVVDGVEELVNCLDYERVVDIDLQEFSLSSEGVTRLMNGSIEITDSATTPTFKDYELSGSNITVTTTLGNLQERFTLFDISWREEYDPTVANTFSSSFDVEVENRNTGAVFEYRSLGGSALGGRIADLHPYEGVMTLLGRSDEAARTNVQNEFSLTFALESEGDRDGDGRGDSTAPNYDLTWNDFLARAFVRPEVEYEE